MGLQTDIDQKEYLDIAFVVLTYNIVDETINCVESISKRIDTVKYRIIVVDNGSRREITNELERALDQYKNVLFLQLDGNLGFAKGNNAGIEYVRKLFQPKYICCLNNDTLLEQRDFCGQIEKAFRDGKPAAIGPKIRLKDGRVYHMGPHLASVEEYEQKLKELSNGNTKKSIRSKLAKYRFFYELNSLRPKHFLNRKRIIDDVLIHGCCIIFTPVFFEKLKGFDDRTFLFCEEELLYIEIKKNKMVTRYAPNIWIRHMEDATTNSLVKNDVEKQAFVNAHKANSLKILIEELKNVDL